MIFRWRSEIYKCKAYCNSDTSTLGIVKTNYEQNLGDEFTVYVNKNVVQIVNVTDSQKAIFKVVETRKIKIIATPVSGSAASVPINVAGYDTNQADVKKEIAEL